MKKIVSLLITVAMIISMSVVLTTVTSASEAWDGTSVAGGYASGAGTEVDPYVIETAAQLKYFADQVNSGAYGAGSAIYVELGSDIDLGGKNWTSIGIAGAPLNAYFDGKGHTVSNFEVTDGEEYFGFIGAAYGTIKNLTIDKATVNVVKKPVAGAAVLVGYAAGDQTLNIENCVVGKDSSVCVNPDSAHTPRIGGFVGSTGAGSGILNIKNCINYGRVTLETTVKENTAVGGIVGIFRNGSIMNCANFGNVTVTAAEEKTRTGGIIGIIQPTTAFVAENCINYGNITGAGHRVGGLVGLLQTEVTGTTSLTNMFSLATEVSSNYSASGTVKVGTIIGGVVHSATYTNVKALAYGDLEACGVIGKAYQGLGGVDTLANLDSKEAFEAMDEYNAILTALRLDHECADNAEVVPGKAATCTEPGLTEGKRCSVCGVTFVAQEKIPALGHSEEIIPGKAATCTEPGLSEGKKCPVCGEIFISQKEIPAGHTEEVIPGKAATCTETGLTDGKKCSACGEILEAQQEIPAGHTEEVIPGKEPTYTETGLTEGKKCSACGEILVAQEEIPMLTPEQTEPEQTEPTQTPTTDAPGTEKPAEGGCGSVVAGGLAILAVVALAGVALKKRD